LRVAVIVPTYNESQNVEQLSRALLALEPHVDVVIVDDASPDGTGDIADAIAADETRMHVVHRTGKRGYSVACKEGVAWCLERGYDAVASMDADLSHDPQVLPRLIAAVENGADLAIGSRYTEGGRIEVDWGPVRMAVSRSGSAYARLMVGTSVKDCTSGYRCYRAKMLARVPLDSIHSEGYSFLIEVLAALRDLGARVVEVPITYVDRRAGSSKISKAIVVEALWLTTGLGIARLVGSRRRAASGA